MQAPLLQNLVGDRGIGQGGAFYRGEGGVASAGEYHNALEPFLGPPSKRIDADPSHQFPHEAWFLPDAYGGRNEYIRETIVQIVINYNSFMTREILPWREQENPNIAWDSIRFDKTLVDMEPEQGIPRYVTVERQAHTDYMVRRGIALIVNHGFAATPGGQKDFMYKVATIAGAVQETCDQAGVMALLRAKNEYRGHVVEAMKTASDAYDLFHHELWRWGIIQHTDRGWYHMDAEAQHVMRCENIQPDTWIVPPRMTSFAAMGQRAETEVYRAGEATARGNLLLGEDNFTTFRGKSVYEIKPYQLDVDGRVVDPLNRSRMIGDFFVVPYYDIRRDGDGPMYPMARRGRTQVYCCESDRFETFCWEDMWEQSKFHEMTPLRDVLAALDPTNGAQPTSGRQDALLYIVGLQIERWLHDNPDARNTGVRVAELLAGAGGAGGAVAAAAWTAIIEQIPHWLRPFVDAAQATDGPAFATALGNPGQLHTATAPFCAAATVTIRRGGRSRAAAGPRWGAHFSGTRFGPETGGVGAANLKAAVEMGLRNQFPTHFADGTDVLDSVRAAQSYAKPLVMVGVDHGPAAQALFAALHHAVASQVDADAHVTESDVATASVQDLHDAYVQGGVPGGYLDIALEQAVPSAFRAAGLSGGPLSDAACVGPQHPVAGVLTYTVPEATEGTGGVLVGMSTDVLHQSYTYSQKELCALYHHEHNTGVPLARSSVQRRSLGCGAWIKAELEAAANQTNLGVLHTWLHAAAQPGAGVAPVAAALAAAGDVDRCCYRRTATGTAVLDSVDAYRAELIKCADVLTRNGACYVYSLREIPALARDEDVYDVLVALVAATTAAQYRNARVDLDFLNNSWIKRRLCGECDRMGLVAGVPLADIDAPMIGRLLVTKKIFRSVLPLDTPNLQQNSAGDLTDELDRAVDYLMPLLRVLHAARPASAGLADLNALGAFWDAAALAVVPGGIIAGINLEVGVLFDRHRYSVAPRDRFDQGDHAGWIAAHRAAHTYYAYNTVSWDPEHPGFRLLDPFNLRPERAALEELRSSPYDLLCFRPFRQYTMGTGVLCKKGSELGNTFRGWADFQLTDNIIAKTHIGHFTFWHASVVTNPKCLFLAEDIFCTNYEGGEGRGVLPWSQMTMFREEPMATMRRNNASIICIPVPVGAINPVDHRLQTNNPISVTGVLDPNMRENTGQQAACAVHIGDYAIKGQSNTVLSDLRQMWSLKRDHITNMNNANAANQLQRFQTSCPQPPVPGPLSGQIPGQTFSDVVDQLWGFGNMNHEVDYAHSKTFETSGRLINTVCFHTMQKFQNPSNLRWEVTNLNTGHFGENGIYEGCKRIRCGFLDYFKDMDYAKAMAMVNRRTESD